MAGGLLDVRGSLWGRSDTQHGGRLVVGVVVVAWFAVVGWLFEGWKRRCRVGNGTVWAVTGWKTVENRLVTDWRVW